MKTVLLTGFEPFGGEAINPSWEVAKALDGQIIGNAKVVAKCLPCVFGDSLERLADYIIDTQPDIVISLGQAGGRSDITPERVAINLDDARIPDNRGAQPLDRPIVEGGETAYFTTLPIKAIVEALRAAGIPASVSYTAGTFVCNHVFYGLQRLAISHGIAKSGFIHIPYLPEQAAKPMGQTGQTAQPSMAFDTLVNGIKLAIDTVVTTDQDIKAVGGYTH